MKIFVPMFRPRNVIGPLLTAFLLLSNNLLANQKSDEQACIDAVKHGFLEALEDPFKPFLVKVREDTAPCCGGEKGVRFRNIPWVDRQNYYATADAKNRHSGRNAITKLDEHLYPNGRGIDGALLDLENQRIELIKFVLFDQNTCREYVQGRDGQPEPTLKTWNTIRLPPQHATYMNVGSACEQFCKGDLITYRTLTSIYIDLRNCSEEVNKRRVPFS